MRKSRFTKSQIVQTLKQVEGGRKVKDVYREIGVSETTCSGQVISDTAIGLSAVHFRS